MPVAFSYFLYTKIFPYYAIHVILEVLILVKLIVCRRQMISLTVYTAARDCIRQLISFASIISGTDILVLLYIPCGVEYNNSHIFVRASI